MSRLAKEGFRAALMLPGLQARGRDDLSVGEGEEAASCHPSPRVPSRVGTALYGQV